MKILKHGFIVVLYIYYAPIIAQTINATIVDKKTNTPIPYATVSIATNQGIIANEEGNFTITLEKKIATIDSIYISSIGYEKTGIAIKDGIDSIIYITPKTIELKSVFISNTDLSVDEIIEQAEDNLEKNYRADLSKKQLFFRETNTSYIKKMEVDFKKSTIEEVNKKLVDSMSNVVPKNSVFYIEALCDYYGNTEKQKLQIIKGARLYNQNNSGSMVSNFKKMEQIFRDNVKPDSYIKFRSGLFSKKIQVDSILSANGGSPTMTDGLVDSNNENLFFKSRKINLKNLFEKTVYQSGTKLDIIRRSGRYNFEQIDVTILDDQGVYVIQFSPKRSGDFKGTLYINTQDFAVMRIDYENVKPLRTFNLLGISYAENGYSGTTIFSKGADGKYGVRFIEKITQNKFGVNRPLSIIEKNRYVKGRRKQNQVSLDLDIISYVKNKFEVIVFDTQLITESIYATTTENKNAKSTYMSSYDPNFWKGHTIIEPNTAIKQFKASEELEQ